jgi:hypothetical protein
VFTSSLDHLIKSYNIIDELVPSFTPNEPLSKSMRPGALFLDVSNLPIELVPVPLKVCGVPVVKPPYQTNLASVFSTIKFSPRMFVSL